LLCSGAYVASDFSLIHAYKNKQYQWGYFPEMISYDEEELFLCKKHERVELLWTGRMIEWKHPEYPIHLAEKLASEGHDFHLTMIGDGDLRDALEKEVIEKKLTEYVTITGFMKPKEVRQIMKKANIYLFTSDYKEGWGAVLNEAMNAGCAVVANVAAGSTPSLIKHEINGLVYENGNFEMFLKRVETLLSDLDKRDRMAREAYKTILQKWNHKVAAKRLYEFCLGVASGKIPKYEHGPIAKAKAIKQSKMYQHMTKE
jgi:glycosyltransferase involved in cell wall biosynthesis